MPQISFSALYWFWRGLESNKYFGCYSFVGGNLKRGTSVIARRQIRNMLERRPGAASSLPDMAPPKRLPMVRPKPIAPSPPLVDGKRTTRRMLLRSGKV